MTDNTQPEALRLAEQYDYGDPIAHSNMWKAAVCTELRRQHARIAELEAQLASIGAGGVQALSAAPAGWKTVPVNPTPEMWKAAKTVPDPNPPYPPHYGLVWDAMLAASPTPPAEQQAALKAAPEQQEWRLVLPGGKYTDEWESARVGDYNRGWNDYRKAAIAALKSVVWPARASGNWVGASTWLRNNYQDYPDIASLCDAMLEAAPQQEAQEPVYQARYKGGDWQDSCRERNEYLKNPQMSKSKDWEFRVLYRTPQPAPAPLSDDAKDAARLDWLALAGPTSICVVVDRPHDGEVEVATDDVTGYGKTLREALDAAIDAAKAGRARLEGKQ